MLPKIDRSGTLVGPSTLSKPVCLSKAALIVLDKGYARYAAAVGRNVMVASRSPSSSGMLYGCVELSIER